MLIRSSASVMFAFIPLFLLQPFVIQLFREFLDVDDSQPRPVDMLEYVEVRVIGDDKFSIRCHGAVHELIVVGIGLYQPEMDVYQGRRVS